MDTGCSLKDQPEVMGNRDGYRETEKSVRAASGGLTICFSIGFIFSLDTAVFNSVFNLVFLFSKVAIHFM